MDIYEAIETGKTKDVSYEVVLADGLNFVIRRKKGNITKLLVANFDNNQFYIKNENTKKTEFNPSKTVIKNFLKDWNLWFTNDWIKYSSNIFMKEIIPIILTCDFYKVAVKSGCDQFDISLAIAHNIGNLRSHYYNVSILTTLRSEFLFQIISDPNFDWNGDYERAIKTGLIYLSIAPENSIHTSSQIGLIVMRKNKSSDLLEKTITEIPEIVPNMIEFINRYRDVINTTEKSVDEIWDFAYEYLKISYLHQKIAGPYRQTEIDLDVFKKDWIKEMTNGKEPLSKDEDNMYSSVFLDGIEVSIGYKFIWFNQDPIIEKNYGYKTDGTLYTKKEIQLLNQANDSNTIVSIINAFDEKFLLNKKDYVFGKTISNDILNYILKDKNK